MSPAATEPHPNSISYSRAIARNLGLQEKDIWRLLTGTRLTVNRFIFDDSPISNADQEQIFRNTLTIAADTAYGLRLGHSLTPPAHGTMGYLANCSPTLLTALEDFGKFLPTRVGFGRLEVLLDNDHIDCLMHVIYKNKDDVLHRVIAEAFALSLIILIEYILGTQLTKAELYFSFPKPQYWNQYATDIHCPIYFDSVNDRLVLPAELKNIPNVSSDFHTYQLYKLQCQKQLSELDAERSTTAERVKKILLLSPLDKPMTEEDVAASMFVSKRTLARRLQSEGAGFREIREEVIVSLAKGYLAETELPVERIATLLNYHDSSSFRRAFKRAVNLSPLAYRETARHEAIN